MNGKITRIKPQEGDKGGYGFLRGEDGHDRFFHANDVVNSEFTVLQQGDAVTFSPFVVQNGAKGNGLRAEQVTRV